MAGRYLSTAHRDDLADGCAFTALSSDTGRAGSDFQAVYARELRRLLDAIAESGPADDAEPARLDDAIALMALCMGGLALSRAVADRPLLRTPGLSPIQPGSVALCSTGGRPGVLVGTDPRSRPLSGGSTLGHPLPGRISLVHLPAENLFRPGIPVNHVSPHRRAGGFAPDRDADSNTAGHLGNAEGHRDPVN